MMVFGDYTELFEIIAFRTGYAGYRDSSIRDIVPSSWVAEVSWWTHHIRIENTSEDLL